MPPSVALDPADNQFLDDMKRRCYRFFVEAAHPTTGLVADRGATDGSSFSPYAGSAGCGFALTAHMIAARSGWVSRDEAAARTERLLRSLVELAAHKNGFLYHFFSTEDGSRRLQSEVSSIDTALLIAGAMTSAMAFNDHPEVVQLADELYGRVDWQWMLGKNDLMHMGWTPENGILPYQWESYSELIVLVLLAIGAPSSPIPPRCWKAWRRGPVLQLDGEDFLSYPPLFVQQYPLAFFDFRSYRPESERSFWDNAVRAHQAQIRFMTELGQAYPKSLGHYGADLWGLTSSDSSDGYRDWGGPYENGRIEPDRGIDGTVVPSAAAGGLAIVPAQALRTLRFQRDNFGEQVYGRYGFVNAFNPATEWVNRDVIGIDTGISMVMAENLQTGSVWSNFMTHPSAQRALQLTGFVAR